MIWSHTGRCCSIASSRVQVQRQQITNEVVCPCGKWCRHGVGCGISLLIIRTLIFSGLGSSPSSRGGGGGGVEGEEGRGRRGGGGGEGRGRRGGEQCSD